MSLPLSTYSTLDPKIKKIFDEISFATVNSRLLPFYFDEVNQKFGVKTNTPTKELDVSGDAIVRGLLQSFNLSVLGSIYSSSLDSSGSITGQRIGASAKANLNNTDLFGNTVINGRIKFSEYTTGTGTATLGTNSPFTVSTPFQWIQATLSDGTAVFIPCWK